MFKLLQLSDCHLLGDANKTGFKDINPYHSLQAVCALCADWSPDLVLVTGDISGDDSAQSYQLFKAMLAGQFDCPVLTLAGNHDNNEQYDTLLGEWDIPASGPVQVGRWCLHGLDTRHRGTLGWVDETQWQAVRKAVDEAPGIYHLLALHHHPKPTRGWMDRHALLNADALCSDLSSMPSVKAVIYGHVHRAARLTLQNTDYLSAPSTCWQFAGTEDFALDNEAPGARKLILHDDGRIETLIVRLPKGA